jgi:formylglycine-generating enzyme required for sulfatase activity
MAKILLVLLALSCISFAQESLDYFKDTTQIAEDEAAKKAAEEEAKRVAEEAAKKAAEEAAKKAAAEEAKRVADEFAKQKTAASEAVKHALADEFSKKAAAEEAARQAEEAAKVVRQRSGASKIKAEEDAKKADEKAASAKKDFEAATAKRIAAEESLKKIIAEDPAEIAAALEAAKKAEEEKKKKEAAEVAKKAEEEKKKKEAAEAAKKAEEDKKAKEAAEVAKKAEEEKKKKDDAEAAKKAGEEKKKKDIKDNLKMVPVRMTMLSTMGCIDNSGECHEDERPTQNIFLNEYFISESQVTQKLWKMVMGVKPPSKRSGPELPVENVSWNDIQKFISELNKITGEKYRLPTEAQWEYAARGGPNSKKLRYSGSDNLDSIAWYNANSEMKIRKVCTRGKNELGLCDMTGNVWEWVQDWKCDYNASSLQTDPECKTQPPTHFRVYRGCSFEDGASNCRISRRGGATPNTKSRNLGFRLVLVP